MATGATLVGLGSPSPEPGARRPGRMLDRNAQDDLDAPIPRKPRAHYGMTLHPATIPASPTRTARSKGRTVISSARSADALLMRGTSELRRPRRLPALHRRDRQPPQHPEASCLRLEMTSAIRGNRTVRGILLDLDGAVYVGRIVLPGSLDAISRIRAAKLPLKFITNTTRRSSNAHHHGRR